MHMLQVHIKCQHKSSYKARICRRVEKMDRKMILLILASSVYFTSALLQDVPNFTITSNPSSTPTGIEGIVTTSSFSCEGRVSRWRACLTNDPRVVNYRINFQVWRQRENIGFYILVGRNTLPSFSATDAALPAEVHVFDTYCIRFEVPQDQQISVLPEDIVGFHIEIIGQRSASTGGLLLSGDESGAVLYREGTPTLTLRERFPLDDLQYIFGAPLLDAVVGAIAGGSEADTAPISTHTASLTYPTSSLRVLPTVYAASSQTIFPTKYTPSVSMTHTRSSAHIPINATRAVKVHVPSEDASIEDSVNRMTSDTTISESQWLCSSVSTYTLNTSISVTNIGVDDSTSNGNDGESTVVYILVAVGIIIAIVSVTLVTAAVIFVCKYNNKKQANKGKVTKARAASEFIYNSSYELYHRHTGIMRPISTGFHSHWSLTHTDSDSIHYSSPSVENHNENAINGSISNPTRIDETPEVCLRNVVTQFQGISYLHRKKSTAKQKSTKETSKSSTHMKQLRGERDEGSAYNNPEMNKEEEEEKRSSETPSAYYSAPIKRVEPTSIFLSENEAYDSRNTTAISLSENETYSSRNGLKSSENEAYNARNPTSILVSENEAYESGNTGGISAESTSGMNTDSVYYASPTGTNCEEFEVSSNLAYGTSPSNIRLLQ